MIRNPRRAVVGMFVVAVLATSLCVRHVSHRRAVVRVGYSLSAATAELRRVEEENRRLRLEKSVLTSPARIERLAGDMGLTRPAPEQIRVVAGPRGEKQP